MERLAKAAKSPGKVYFVGGTTALLLGIRDQTIDIDLKMDPEPAGAFEAIASLKEELDVNIELASPDDFIPVRADWREHSVLIATIGAVSFYHFDPYSQALAKIERGHAQDLADVRAWIQIKWIEKELIQDQFSKIRPGLLRYPALDANAFEQKIHDFVKAPS